MAEEWELCGTFVLKRTSMSSFASKFYIVKRCSEEYFKLNVNPSCEEREKNWKISSRLTFSDKGLVNERIFEDVGVYQYLNIFQKALILHS